MRLLKRASIRTKLKLVILSTSVLSIVCVFAGFFLYEHITYRERLANDLATKADIIAENSNAALAFRDSADASQVLRSLASQPRITAAAIYDQEGMPFVSYARVGQQGKFPQRAEVEGWRFEEDALVLSKQILLNEARIGTIYLSTDLVARNERFRSYVQIAFLVLVGSLLVAYAVATALERNISGPLLDLAETAHQVSERRDYSIRASKKTNDEIGLLADSVNQMLAHIQERDADLRRTNEVMTEEIAERRRAEQILKESEERFRKLFHDHPLPMWVFDSETLLFVEVNEAAVKHYGYSREEFQKMTIKDIRPPEEIERLVEDLLQEHKGLDASGVWKHKKKDGKIIDVEITSHQLEFVGRNAKLVLANDVTDRKRAEEALRESESRYRTTLDHMMEGCQIIGFDFRYLYVNEVAARQGRRRRQELLGHTMMEVYPGIESTPMFAKLRRCMEERLLQRMENEFIFPDGTRGWFNLNLEPVAEGTFILSEDITKEKELDEELQRHREHLEELVVQRTAQLESANTELESFSYSVSHDLRAPLRHIDGFADLLTKSGASRLDEKSRRYLNTISDSAKRMGILIDELLVFSRMGRTEMQNSLVDLHQLAQEVIQDILPDVAGRTIDWKVAPLPHVKGDPSMMRLVLVNLISNAVKYTRTRLEARIEIGFRPGDGETVFFVRDNGAGFEMQYVDKLFRVFQRLHASDEFEGTGVGLANVRRIIQRHGGRTWAEGEVDSGATFYFSLPVKRGENTSEPLTRSA